MCARLSQGRFLISHAPCLVTVKRKREIDFRQILKWKFEWKKKVCGERIWACVWLTWKTIFHFSVQMNDWRRNLAWLKGMVSLELIV